MKKTVTALFALVCFMSISIAQVTVSGNLTNEQGDPLEGVTVTSGANNPTTVTDEYGNYSLSLTSGGDYTIAPILNVAHLNGVTTLDMVLTERHVLGIDTLDSPYKIIAADINLTNTVTIQDAIDIYHGVLFMPSPLFSNNSWRFVLADYVFPDPLNPFSPAFPEAETVNNLTDDITDLDFIGIKMGDVNNTAAYEPFFGGNTFVTGKVVFDENDDCQIGTNETPLSGWNAYARAASGVKHWGKTGADGVFHIPVPAGTYDVFVIEPNSLWDVCVDSVMGVVIDPTGVNPVSYFAAQATDICPNMEVNMNTFFLRRCFENTYFVNYCNLGTEEATGTYIEVTLDSFFTDVSSSIPWSSVDGRTYTFDIGTVPIGVCGSFYIEFTIDCDAEFGQTHCSEAYIFPEPPCTPVAPLYGGGEIEVTAECTSADVIFTMTNHGDPLTEPVEYIVIEDIMIQMSDQFTPLLGTGETHTVTVPANGSTWRLMSNEVSDHPFETIATTAVEGCGVDSTGSFSLGFINMYPLSDEEPFMDEDCQENIGSYDPNDKTGYPLGYEDEHFIERGQDLDYRIRFQNTGTDTAFSVVIIDTLPAELDPGSLRIQGFSHPMTYDLIGEGVVVFRFADIMLPDSNVNEPASHGFVKFTIDQQPGLEIGTTIENEAAIYFDFNEPIITNLTLHTIGEPIFEVEVTSTTVQIPNVNLNVYPNPFDTEANFDFNGHDLEEGTIRIFDVQGKMVKSQSFTGSQFKMDGSSLTEGFYFFQITDTGRNVASGKLMVK